MAITTHTLPARAGPSRSYTFRPTPRSSTIWNPIEIQWREIKAAIADIFGGLDKMRDAIIRMLHNKEIPIVRLFEWLLFP